MNERIKELRKALNLTQQEFAGRLNVSRNTVATYEIGKSNPSDAAVMLICREFSVNEEWLRDGTGEMFLLPDDETAALVSEILENPDGRFYQAVLNLVRTYEQLSPESKEVLDDFIDKVIENSKTRKD